HYRLDRFKVMSTANYVYLPDTSNENFRFEQCIVAENFVANILRLDCLELSTVTNGISISKRRGNVNSYGSLCIVAEINDETRKNLGIATNIVWIPLFEQVEDLIFMEKY